jgi:hypothetical protein
MSAPSLTYLLRGPFNFLHPDTEELHRLVPDAQESLPLPLRVFLEDESATPLWGFPILVSPRFARLRAALQEYLTQEEQVQAARVLRSRADNQAYNQAWETYRQLLSTALENVTLSSYGRNYPGIFWLYHSLDVARHLKETPRRMMRIDTGLGRSHGDELKYKVFDRFQDRMLSATYDLVNRLAVDTEEVEEELFPRLLRRMLDNVLIFTEDYVSTTLAELTSYFQGYLKIDGRDLRQRLQLLADWHEEQLRTNTQLRSTVGQLLQRNPDTDHRRLLCHGPYLRLLAELPAYDPERLLPPTSLAVWEKLLGKLKEFELFHALRRFAIPMKRREDRLYCRPSGMSRTWVGSQELFLSSSTRPLDFMEPWVVDPVVQRFGMIYDITEFSGIVSRIRLSGSEAQDHTFRMMFRFQRRINRLAHSYRIKLEKYLGDGAFYSSRAASQLILCAVQLQRYYAQALEDGFPFDRGLRIALNFGSYRLIPLRSTSRDDTDRYEFFGHGLIELSRLTTGKATKELDEIKNLLITQGYPEGQVHRFFAPMLERNVDMVDREQTAKRFHAYINRNGHLINEGIVATERFLRQLNDEVLPRPVYRLKRGKARYLALDLQEGGEGGSPLGIRKLGQVHLKGLEDLPVYEVIDLSDALPEERIPLEVDDLVAALEREWMHERELSGETAAASSTKPDLDLKGLEDLEDLQGLPDSPSLPDSQGEWP